MHDARLYVDGQEADFYKSEELAPRITRQIFDLTQLSGAAGDFTLSLVLPNTARNDRLFGWPGDLQARLPFFGQGRRAAVVEVDGQVVIKGSLTIDSREKNGYGATILGNNVAWAELLAARQLRDLATFRRLLYTGIRSSIYHPWPEHVSGSVGLKDIWPTFEGGAYEVQFPLVGYGNFDSNPEDDTTLNPLNGLELVKGSAGIIDGALIYNDADATTGWPFDQFRFYGGAYARDIMRRIFAEAGYRVGGTWFDDPANVNLFVPFVDSGDAQPQWNWGTLGLMKARTQVPSWYYPKHSAWFGALFNPGDPEPPAQYADVIHFSTTLVPGVSNQHLTEMQYFRVPFDETRFDYSFSNQREQCVALVDQMVDIQVTVSIAEFWNFIIDPFFPAIDVADQAARILSENMGRCLIMILRNPPDPADAATGNSTQWDNLEDGFLQNGSPIENANILAYIDLNAKTFQHVPHTFGTNHKGYFFNLSDGALPGSFTLAAPDATFQKGDRYSVVVALRGYWELGDPFPNQRFFYQKLVDVSATIEVSNIRKPDGTPYPTHLTAAALLPDMAQIDFVKSFIAQSNLFVAVNERAKLVTLNYPNTFLLPGEAAVDWSDKVDMAQASVAPSCRFRRFVFDMQQQEGETLLDWRKYRLVVDNDGRNATDDFEAVLAFAPTAPRTYTWVQHPGLKLPLPTLNTAEEFAKFLGALGSGEQQTKLAYKPRLLRWEGFVQTQESAPPFVVGAFGADDTFYRFPMNDSTDIDFSLYQGAFWWPKASVLPNFTWPGSDGLYDSYYADSVRQLLKGVKAVTLVMLRPADMQTLDQRRPVVIDGILYTLNKVEDYNPVVPQPTKCTLIRRY